MKNRIILRLGLLLFLSSGYLSCERNEIPGTFPENSITIYSAPELSEITSNWASIFCKLNPDVKIKVVEAAESSIVENLDQSRNLGFITDEYRASNSETSPWKEVVGREVIVLVINSENPFMDEISQQGITIEELALIINNEGITSWKTLLNTGEDVPVHLYMINDASVESGMAELLNVEQVKINGVELEEGKELISAVENDLYSIGICKIASVIDYSDQTVNERVRLLPIDRDGDGNMDFKESIYSDLTVFSRGVWIGKYPSALINNIYFVSSSQPRNENEVAFLKWILGSGQQLLDNYGYSNLETNERLAKVKLIDNYDIAHPATAGFALPKKSLFSNIYFLAFLTLSIIILLLTISGYFLREKKKVEILDGTPVPMPVFSQDFVNSPQGLYYGKTHTWAFMDEDGLVKIGIDDFLQHVTGPLTNIKMKYPGEKVRKGRHVLSIVQDGKQLDICAPVSGTIRELNKSLATNTSIINQSPYTEGWIYKIEPTNWVKEIQFLLLGNTYKEWLKNEFSRLKEFFAESLRPEAVKYAHVLQDGGELRDSILKDFGPEVWEEFQTNFIDVSS